MTLDECALLMRYFFNSPERMALLQREAQSWFGTPFRDGIGARAKRGTACDCVSFVAAVLHACGAIGHVPWPKGYVSMTGGPAMLEVLLKTLGSIERLARVEGAFLPGDVLVGSTGRSRHHIALYLGNNRLAHCWAGRVQEGNLKDPMLMKHLHSVWRPVEHSIPESRLS